MGLIDSCLACLCGRRDDVENYGETSRLLPDDYRIGYGSSNGQRNGFQPDSESIRREREALDGICHSMSDNVEDLFLAKGHLNSRLQSGNEEGASRPKTPELGQSGSQEVALRTIRKGGLGPISNALRRQSEGWRAVQDAIG